MTKILKPGRYSGVPSDLYHSAGWTQQPALSSSGARLLETECPALYWHRYLDPNRQPEQKRSFDIGTAVHLLVLEPDLFDSRVSIIKADDYRTKDAREAKERAYLAGKVPLLEHEAAKVKAMRDSVFRHPIAKLGFIGGEAEVSYAWKDKETGIWCKSRPDYVPPHDRYFIDVKSSTSANPRHFEKRVWDLGYHMQAAWYLDSKEAIDGVRPERFCFIVVSTEPPHLVTAIWLDEETVAWGALQNQRARRLFAQCLERDEWPAYRDPEKPDVDTAFTLTLPPWAKRDLEKQHEAGRFVERALVDEGASPFV